MSTAAGHSFRRIAIVSPHFPPSTLAGVHRARHLAKHLPANGWQPTVICVDEAHHTEQLDHGLSRLLPPGLDIIKVGALPAHICRYAGIGDIGIRAFWPLKTAIDRLIIRTPVDAVLITGSPFYPMLLARHISKVHQIPVVLDFQDPWVSRWGETQSVRTKAGAAHALARVLEPKVLRHAAFVTSVSDVQNEELAARYPWLAPQRMAAIPIGGDPEDYDFLRSNPMSGGPFQLEPGAINFSFVGTIMPRTGPVLEQLIRALVKLRSQQPALADCIRLNFVGTSNQPSGQPPPSSCLLQSTSV